jgi:hypothetical protein
MATAYTPEVAELPRSPRAFDTVTGMREHTYSAVNVLLLAKGLQYQAPGVMGAVNSKSYS